MPATREYQTISVWFAESFESSGVDGVGTFDSISLFVNLHRELPFTKAFSRSASLPTIAAEAASIDALAVGRFCIFVIVVTCADQLIVKLDAFDADALVILDGIAPDHFAAVPGVTKGERRPFVVNAMVQPHCDRRRR